MRVLYLRTAYALDLQAGGSVAHTAGVINEFSKLVELDVVSNSLLPGVRRKIEIILPVLVPFIGCGANELLYNLKLILKLKGRRYDVVYQRHSGFSFVGAVLKRIYGSLYVLEYNGSEVWMARHWEGLEKGRLLQRLLGLIKKAIKLPIVFVVERFNLLSADLIVVVSSAMKEELLARGLPEEKILVNPNGVDPKVYTPDVDASDIRERLGLFNKKVVGFIGTFGPWHGVIELSRAIVRFFDKYSCKDGISDVVFLLIGNGLLLDEARQIIENCPYSDRVIFTGSIPQEEAVKYLAACDIYVSPHVPNPDGTEFFGSPTKLFEYMAMEKPIIASRLGQIGQILEHKKTAYLVKPADVEELADAIYEVASNLDCYKYLGENARREVLREYTWEKHVSRIVEAISSIYDVKGHY